VFDSDTSRYTFILVFSLLVGAFFWLFNSMSEANDMRLKAEEECSAGFGGLPCSCVYRSQDSNAAFFDCKLAVMVGWD